MIALGTNMWLTLAAGRVPAVKSSCCALTTQQSAPNQALGVFGGQHSRQSKHSPQAAPACLQDMSICQDVRVEDMGHKQGCNGVDKGKLWFNRELLQQNSKAICSCWKWSLGVLAPVFAVAAYLLQPLHWLQSSALLELNDLLPCRCQDSQDSPTQCLLER